MAENNQKIKLLKIIEYLRAESDSGNCAIYLAEKDLYHGMNLLRITPKNINVWYMFYYLKSMAFKRNESAIF